ncbi:helix-turn-helix transcriptional regulator [Fructobacillus fructosus]|uniref:helix-turn-helix domain-containing protein n=1 Tax=Fructobacillus fructosus TaxID=1631 RepID=UPI0030C86CD1
MNDNRLKLLRKKRGLTLDQISRETGVKRATFGKYENCDSEPKLTTWVALAKFFNVTPQYLVGWTDEPH